MGTPDQLHGSGLGRGVIKGDPAADHLVGIDPVEVGAILMHAQWPGANGLPQHVVDLDAGSGPSSQSGAGPADIFSQDRFGNCPVPLPAVADLACQGRVADAVLPVDLVGADAGLEFAAEHPLVTRLDSLGSVIVDQVVDKDETVAMEGLDFAIRQFESAHGRQSR